MSKTKKEIINDIYGNPVGEMDVPVGERSISQEWQLIRGQRNLLLAETDVYGLSDRTMTAEMKNYRQKLRDLPSTQADPADIVWPTKPE